MSKKTKGLTVFLSLIICVLLSLLIYSAFLSTKNEKYTKNLKEYSYYIPTAANSHYVEYDDKFSVRVWNLFEPSLHKPMASVEISIGDVYWEAMDDYINISLDIQEDLTGNFRYILSYESNPLFIKYDNGKTSSTIKQQRQAFILDDELDINNRCFCRDNAEAIKALIDKAYYYWNLQVDFEPDNL